MAEILSTTDINRDFPSGSGVVHALRDININVEEKTLTILRGRSGSGKTTLLNLIGALDKPTSGIILFGGRDITKMSEHARDGLRRTDIGYVFQSVALISMMSAYENVEFGLRVAGYPAKDRKKRAEECLEFVGLQKRMTHRPSELSGGEQQRVAIARAIAHKPKLLIADEPTAELDTHMGLQIMYVFRELVENEGCTVLMSTHDPNMIELGDHVYSLADGVVVEEIHNDIGKITGGGVL